MRAPVATLHVHRGAVRTSAIGCSRLDSGKHTAVGGLAPVRVIVKAIDDKARRVREIECASIRGKRLAVRSHDAVRHFPQAALVVAILTRSADDQGLIERARKIAPPRNNTTDKETKERDKLGVGRELADLAPFG